MGNFQLEIGCELSRHGCKATARWDEKSLAWKRSFSRAKPGYFLRLARQHRCNPNEELRFQRQIDGECRARLLLLTEIGPRCVSTTVLLMASVGARANCPISGTLTTTFQTIRSRTYSSVSSRPSRLISSLNPQKSYR